MLRSLWHTHYLIPKTDSGIFRAQISPNISLAEGDKYVPHKNSKICIPIFRYILFFLYIKTEMPEINDKIPTFSLNLYTYISNQMNFISISYPDF